jgi:hypothetical protein
MNNFFGKLKVLAYSMALAIFFAGITPLFSQNKGIPRILINPKGHSAKINNLLFTKNIKNTTLINSIKNIQNEVTLYQTNPEYNAPKSLLLEVKRILTTANNLDESN